MKKFLLILLIISLFPAGFSGCGTRQPVTKEIFAMDTIMDLKLWGSEDELNAVAARINELERALSAQLEQSDIGQLNKTGNAELSDDTASLLQTAVTLSERTGGAFDPTVYPLVAAWGFPTRQYVVPSQEELSSILPHIGISKLTLSDHSALLPEGTMLDLGGIAKGFAGQECASLCDSPALFSLGGNVQTVGTKPDGSDWVVGIADPKAPDLPIAKIRFTGTHSLVTSGGYQRYFEQDGVTYCHILDPETGFPVQNELASATIFCEDGALADALSTALYVMGLEKAIAFWQASSDFEAVFILKDGTILATQGMPISDCTYESIKRG